MIKERNLKPKQNKTIKTTKRMIKRADYQESPLIDLSTEVYYTFDNNNTLTQTNILSYILCWNMACKRLDCKQRKEVY